MRKNIVQFGNEYLSINKVFEFMTCGLLTTSVLEWLGMGSAFVFSHVPKVVS